MRLSHLQITREGEIIFSSVLPYTRLARTYLKNRFLRKSLPFVFAHMVTFRCNMRCHYCTYWRMGGEEMGFGEIVRALEEASDLGIATYTATGGEPLLREDVGDIISTTRDFGFHTTLVTNGLLLRKRDTGNPDLLTVSLDTLEREKFVRITGVDALERVKENIAWACERFRVNINVVVHEENVDEISGLVEFADSVGAGVTFEPVSSYFAGCPEIPKESMRRAFARVLELKRDYRCIWNTRRYLEIVASGRKFQCLPHLLLRVNPDGKVIAPCYEVESRVVGDLRAESLRDVVEGERFVRTWNSYRNCGKCYLLCYAEPSIAFSGFLMAIESVAELIRMHMQKMSFGRS
ncbi:DUF3463 domain-containing protein [Geoglobus sp.]